MKSLIVFELQLSMRIESISFPAPSCEPVVEGQGYAGSKEKEVTFRPILGGAPRVYRISRPLN